jgi:hypothetical protein
VEPSCSIHTYDTRFEEKKKRHMGSQSVYIHHFSHLLDDDLTQNVYEVGDPPMMSNNIADPVKTIGVDARYEQQTVRAAEADRNVDTGRPDADDIQGPGSGPFVSYFKFRNAT